MKISSLLHMMPEWARDMFLTTEQVHHANTWTIVLCTTGAKPVEFEDQAAHPVVIKFIQNNYGKRKIIGFNYLFGVELSREEMVLDFPRLERAFLAGADLHTLNTMIELANRTANFGKFGAIGQHVGW